MKRTVILSLAITTILFATAIVALAESFSGTYKIQVYIPPMVGVNLSAQDTLSAPAETNPEWMTTIDKVVRNNEIVMCKTTVIK